MSIMGWRIQANLTSPSEGNLTNPPPGYDLHRLNGTLHKSLGGGIGRHAGLKNHFSQESASSILAGGNVEDHK